jgi:hypothetical protein
VLAGVAVRPAARQQHVQLHLRRGALQAQAREEAHNRLAVGLPAGKGALDVGAAAQGGLEVGGCGGCGRVGGGAPEQAHPRMWARPGRLRKALCRRVASAAPAPHRNSTSSSASSTAGVAMPGSGRMRWLRSFCGRGGGERGKG